jgi:hypothetical protein
LNYSAKHETILLATSAKDRWEKNCGNAELPMKASKSVQKTSRRRYTTLTFFLIFLERSPGATRGDLYRTFRELSEKKSTEIGVPSESYGRFTIGRPNRREFLNENDRDETTALYPFPFLYFCLFSSSILSLSLSFYFFFFFSFLFFVSVFYVTEGEKHGSGVDSVCGVIKREMVAAR